MMAVPSLSASPWRVAERAPASASAPASVSASVPVCAKPDSTSQGDTASLSSLGRVLSGAISRAEATTQGKSDNELRAIVKRAEVHLNDDWRRDMARFAKEVPDGADEGRLAISRQATRYIDQMTTPPRAAGIACENPFFGLGRAELAAIQYDESGSFTTNERRAAASEAGRQYGEWSAEVCARAAKERALTGKSDHVLSEILAYFDALPAIERAALPKGYMERLRAEVAASENDDTRACPDPLSMALACRWQGENANQHLLQE